MQKEKGLEQVCKTAALKLYCNPHWRYREDMYRSTHRSRGAILDAVRFHGVPTGSTSLSLSFLTDSNTFQNLQKLNAVQIANSGCCTIENLWNSLMYAV